MHSPPITLTTLDRSRILELIDRSRVPEGPAAHVTMLDGCLHEAIVVEPAQIPRSVATLNSRVVFRMHRGNNIRVLTVDLVQPADADPVLARHSVLSPTGSALIGLREGESIDWPDDTGALARYTLVQVIFQPEAVGRFDL